MSEIRVLPEDIILKIAAGEVIERPASVIKELLENSIDAGATEVLVELNGDDIRILDNGKGMIESDLQICYYRHSTSKLKTAEDLFDIHSLGFRGEALASISAVSLLEVTSKTSEDSAANRIIIEGGNKVSFGPAPFPYSSGTEMNVKNLFFNTPVRKKYMRTKSTETRVINEVICSYMLAHQNVGFKFVSNGKTIINTPKAATLTDRYYQIYGKEAKEMIALESITSAESDETRNELLQSGITVGGLISTPKIWRKNRSDQILFVNGRLIRSGIIYSAISNAYKGYLNTNEHPLVILRINVDPQKIDVNVHPTKQEIKFEEEQLIYRAIYHTVKDALRATPLKRDIELNKKQEETEKQNSLVELAQDDFKPAPIKKTSPKPEAKEEPKKESSMADKIKSIQNTIKKVEEKTSTTIEEPKKEYKSAPVKPKKTEEPKEEIKIAPKSIVEESEPKNIVHQTLLDKEDVTTHQSCVTKPIETKYDTELKVLGIFSKEFIVAEDLSSEKLVLIDFHAAAEIANYEKFSREYEEGGIATQILLEPVMMDFSIQDQLLIIENRDHFKRLGFNIEEFGDGTLLVRSIPTVFGRTIDKNLIYDIIADLRADKKTNSIDKIKDTIITRMACRASEKAGDDLTVIQAQKIIRNMFALKGNSYNCPHGRPTLVEFSKTELEKMFKRIR